VLPDDNPDMPHSVVEGCTPPKIPQPYVVKANPNWLVVGSTSVLYEGDTEGGATPAVNPVQPSSEADTAPISKGSGVDKLHATPVLPSPSPTNPDPDPTPKPAGQKGAPSASREPKAAPAPVGPENSATPNTDAVGDGKRTSSPTKGRTSPTQDIDQVPVALGNIRTGSLAWVIIGVSIAATACLAM
jgi:hypothetical protein